MPARASKAEVTKERNRTEVVDGRVDGGMGLWGVGLRAGGKERGAPYGGKVPLNASGNRRLVRDHGRTDREVRPPSAPVTPYGLTVMLSRVAVQRAPVVWLVTGRPMVTLVAMVMVAVPIVVQVVPSDER